MKKYIYPLLALGLSVTTACVDDEGNYNYKDINEVTIEDDTEPIQALAYVDHVVITPKITGSIYGDDLDNYEFRYNLCHDDHTHQVIGTEKDLDWVAEVKPGDYWIYFTVKDKRTGVETIKSEPRRLYVSSPFSTGFMLLGENMETGETQVDMLAMIANRDTVMIPDVVDQSEITLGKPNKIIFTGEIDAYLGAEQKFKQNLWISDETEAYEFTNGDSFEFLRSFNNSGIIESIVAMERPMKLVDIFPHQGPYGSNKCRQYRGYLTNDMLFYTSVNRYDSHTQPCNRYSATNQVYFKPAPYMFYAAAWASTCDCTLGYDLTNDCFYKLLSNTSYLMYHYVQPAANYDYGEDVPWKYDCKSEGRTIVYGENTYYGTLGRSYAIMRDKEGPGYYIYLMDMPRTSTSSINKELYIVDPGTAVGFENASHYTFSSMRKAVFYAVGNRLYQYDFSYNTIMYIDFDDEITYLKTDCISDGMKNELLIATYGSENKGTLYKYVHTDNSNYLSLEPIEGEEWHTDLRIKDITWKDAN